MTEKPEGLRGLLPSHFFPNVMLKQLRLCEKHTKCCIFISSPRTRNSAPPSILANIFLGQFQNLVLFQNLNLVASEDPDGNLNFRTNINAQQSARNEAMICKRNKFIDWTNVSLRLATSSEYE